MSVYGDTVRESFWWLRELKLQLGFRACECVRGKFCVNCALVRGVGGCLMLRYKTGRARTDLGSKERTRRQRNKVSE
jgi:hypothetical protein